MLPSLQSWGSALARHGFERNGHPGRFQRGSLHARFDGNWFEFRQRDIGKTSPKLWKEVANGWRLDLPCGAIAGEPCPEEAAGRLVGCLVGAAPSPDGVEPNPDDWFSGLELEIDFGGKVARVHVEHELNAFRLSLPLSDSIRGARAALAEELVTQANERCRMVRFITQPGNSHTQVVAAIDLTGLPVINPGLVATAVEAIKAGSLWLAPSLMLLADQSSISPAFFSSITPQNHK